MYSHEIEKLLKIKNNLITLQEYIQIIKSPQVKNIKYNNETNEFNLWTDDNYKFTLKIQ